MIDAIIGLIGLMLIFFLPGFMLTLAIFPKRGALDREFDLLFKGVLGIVLSLIVAIAVGIILNELGEIAQKPMIRSTELWIALGSATVLFGVIAWWREGLQGFVGEIRRMIPGKGLRAEDEFSRLAHRKRELQTRLAQMDGPDYQLDEALREEAKVRIPIIEKEITEISTRIDALLTEEEKGENDAKKRGDQ